MAKGEEFKIKPHNELPDKEMVEYWRDGKFVAGIYPSPRWDSVGEQIYGAHPAGT